MSMKAWEKKVLEAPGAAERVAEIEDELRLAAGLTALRERAGLSQRELAKRIGVSQPRVAKIEQSRNVTIDVLEQYIRALGGELEVTAFQGSRKIPLLAARSASAPKAKPKARPKTARTSSK
jgi:transcriptional regulator with XRE-family HTH domain